MGNDDFGDDFVSLYMRCAECKRRYVVECVYPSDKPMFCPFCGHKAEPTKDEDDDC